MTLGYIYNLVGPYVIGSPFPDVKAPLGVFVNKHPNPSLLTEMMAVVSEKWWSHFFIQKWLVWDRKLMRQKSQGQGPLATDTSQGSNSWRIFSRLATGLFCTDLI